MARLALNKSSLARETSQLAEYQRFLPSLQLKRLQIVAERARAKAEAARLDAEFQQRFKEIADDIPMLANDHVPLSGLVLLKKAVLESQNLSGTKLPVLGPVEIDVKPYSMLGLPHWVDAVADALKALIGLKLEKEVADQRFKQLVAAEAVISRRVNLFEKVLIPQAERNIRRIRMALADAERDAVVRAKISKRKTAARAAVERMARL